MVTTVEGLASYKIIVVGAGQIGSRHLQGLARARSSLSIELVDPSQSAREVALGRYREIDRTGLPHQSINAIASVDSSGFGGSADLAIVATGARERPAAIRSLLEQVKVRRLLLEKFLFQKLSEFSEAKERLEFASTEAWVNCPRRTFDWARQLKKVFSGQKLSVVAKGGNWGLGCNAIHLVDLASFLCGSSDIREWDTGGLDATLYDAKRSGCIEFGGTLATTIGGVHRLSISDDKSSTSSVILEIIGEEFRAVVSEGDGTLQLFSNKTGLQVEARNIALPFQSEMTGAVADALLYSGKCDLTPFDESSKLHKGLLGAYLSHMARIRGQLEERCPIT